MSIRTVVLWVPDWPVLAAMTQEEIPADQPVAVHDGRALTAVSAVARAQGVRRGMRRREAQRRCPELVLLHRDEGRDVRAFEPVAVAAETVVAGVEVTRPGMLLLPAGGASRYHGSEHVLAEQLVTQVAELTGHESQVGVADGLLAAVLAARASLVVPPDASAAFLAPRGVSELLHAVAGERAMAEVGAFIDLLHRLGLRTLGALVALPAAAVSARFGPVGSWAHRLARGEDLRPAALRRIEQDIEVGYDFDEPAQRVDEAAFAARRIAEELYTLLVDRSASCGRLRITARTEGGQELVRTWRTDIGALGALTAARITDRVRWQLEGWLSGSAQGPEPAPLIHLGLCAEEVVTAGAEQELLWGGVSGSDSRAHRALLRVQGLLGGDGVLTAEVQGGRAPSDQVHLVPWGQAVPPVRPADRPWPGRLPEPAPATVLTASVPARVLDAAQRAVQVDARLALSAPPALVAVPPEPPTTVLAWAGPWPVAERWWTPEGRRRVYLQVALENGRVLLLASSRGVWSVEALYD